MNSLPNTINKFNSNIKHIVLSGGGTYGFAAYGALKHLHEEGFWNIRNIESIHGTSIGAIYGIILALKYDWNISYDYIIKRPWHKIFNFDMYSVIHSFQKKGIFDKNVIIELFKPLFNGLDIPLDINMLAFYEITKIDLHVYITNLTDFTLVDISHKTHPEWIVIDAVYASSALPILFAPLIKDEKCYLDGGILCNYPIHNCLNQISLNQFSLNQISLNQNSLNQNSLNQIQDISLNCIENTLDTNSSVNLNNELCVDPKNTILGLYRHQNESIQLINSESSIFDYLFLIINKLLHSIMPIIEPILNQYQIPIISNTLSLYDIYLCSNSEEERIRIFNIGINAAKSFIDEHRINI